MAKGMISQSAVLLTIGSVDIAAFKDQLKKNDFEVLKETPPSDAWQFGGVSILIPYRPDINGYVSIDVVNQTWPDGMGDPKMDATTFGAWSMGHFGPWAYPNGLQRAGQHAWSWGQAKDAVKKHSGFVRIRLSYAFGAPEELPVLPATYDPLDEMNFIGRVILAAIEAPGILCYFNPNGEVLRDRDGYLKTWNECKVDQSLPLSLWSNIRFFNLSENLLFMDTVGNYQLDAMDVEAIFPRAAYGPSDVDWYLRNVTQYLIDARPEFKTGQAIDGPNENNLSWTVEIVEDGMVSPPRKVLRLYPKENKREVVATMSRSL